MDLEKMDQYWNNYWKNKKIYKTSNDNLLLKTSIINPKIDINNSYILTINDIYARYLRKLGYNVLNSYLISDIDSSVNIINKLGLSVDYSKIYFENDEVLFNFKNEIINKIKNTKYYNRYNNQINLLDFYKENDLEELNIKEIMEVYFEIKDFLGNLKFETNDYMYLYGLSFVSIPVNLDIVNELITYDEIESYNLFLENNNELEIFSGRYAICPITKKEIPILITKRYEKNHLGIPFINQIDLEIANKFYLDINNVMENDFFINSCMLNGLNLEEAKEKMASLLILSNRGIIKKDYPLVNINLDEIDFLEIIMNFIPIIYHDDYILFEEEFINELHKFNNINFYSFYNKNKSNYILSIFIAKIIYKTKFINKYFSLKEKNINLDYSVDENRLLIILKNGEILNIYRFLENIWKLGFMIVDENIYLDELYNVMMKKVKYYYEIFDFENIINIINIFINEALKIKKISPKQMIGLLNILNPIIPVITEELYRTLFNNYETISYLEL